MTQSGPEEFMNLQGLLVQSSKWFGISSVQFSSPAWSDQLPFSSVQFWARGQVPQFSSNRRCFCERQNGLASVQFSSPAWSDQPLFSSVHWTGPSASVQFIQFPNYSGPGPSIEKNLDDLVNFQLSYACWKIAVNYLFLPVKLVCMHQCHKLS